MGYEHREDAVAGGESGNCKQTQTYTHTHTKSVPTDTEDGWSLKQGSDAF